MSDHVSSLRENLHIILKAFKQRKQKELRKENDRLLKQAALDFTKPIYRLAVLSYVLGKIVSKPRFFRKSLLPRMRKIESRIREAANKANRASEEELLELLEAVEQAIEHLEEQDSRYLINLVSKGRLKVAATLYAQGVSLGLASEMTGMDKQDILDYTGKTKMSDRIKEEKSIHERLKIARRLIS